LRQYSSSSESSWAGNEKKKTDPTIFEWISFSTGKEEFFASKFGAKGTGISCSQFHQHFKNGYFANILSTKNYKRKL